MKAEQLAAIASALQELSEKLFTVTAELLDKSAEEAYIDTVIWKYYPFERPPLITRRHGKHFQSRFCVGVANLQEAIDWWGEQKDPPVYETSCK